MNLRRLNYISQNLSPVYFWLEWAEGHSCEKFGGGVWGYSHSIARTSCLSSAVSRPARDSSWACHCSAFPGSSCSSCNSWAWCVCLALWWRALLLQDIHAIKVRRIKNWYKFQSLPLSYSLCLWIPTCSKIGYSPFYIHLLFLTAFPWTSSSNIRCEDNNLTDMN